MLKIQSVDIEGFHNVDKKHYEFKDLNYLKGPNGAGKSTVLQAIQLALLGYIPGSNKNKEAIFRHSNGKLLAVTVYLTGDTDVKISRIWSGTGSMISSVVDIDPKGYDISELVSNIELPVFNFSEFLNLTANKQKDWFLNFLPKKTWSIDWNKELSDSLKDKNIQGIDDIKDTVISEITNCGLEGVESIRYANNYLKAELSAHKSELNRLQGSIQSYVYYDDLDNTDVVELDKNIQEYQQLKSLRMKFDSEKAAIEKIENSLQEYSDLGPSLETDENYIKCNKRIQTLENQIVEEKSKRSEIIQKKYAIGSQIQPLTKLVESGKCCPILYTECEKLVNKVSETSKLLEEKRSELESIDKKLQSIENSINTTSSVLESCKDVCSRLSYSYSMRDKLKSDMNNISLIDSSLVDTRSISELDSELNSLYETKTKVLANQKYSSIIDEITKQKYKVESEIEALNIWINLTGVNGLQNGNPNCDPFDILKNSMDKYIIKLFGKRTKTEVNMERKANSFSFGISRNKTYIPYDLLSSGEKCMYALALMLSLVDISNSKIKLILVDDMFDHLDDQNIESLFNVLGKISDIQMIFAGVKDIKKGGNIISIK